MLILSPSRHRVRLLALSTRPILAVRFPIARQSASFHTSPSCAVAGGGQIWLKSPRDLAQHLDEHIIGQERAKKILSVAVFNHYHRVTTLLDRSEEHGEGSDADSGYSEGDAQDAGTQFTGSTVATATITPKPRKRRSDTKNGKDIASSRKEADDDRFIDPEQYERNRRTDPTLIHSPEEWSTAQPGFYDKAFPPPTPRHTAESIPEPSSTQTSTLLGRLTRGSIAPNRASLSDGLAAPGTDSGVEPFADIRATNSPSLAPRKEKTGRLSSETKDSGGAVRGRAKEDDARRTGQVSDEADDVGQLEEDLVSMDDVVIEKSNVLMIGPTGSGKTLLAKTLARVLDVPFASSDATSFTQAGYVGDDVENCVLRLLRAADHDVTRAEIGIIHIDECDKLARRGGVGDGAWGGRDVGGEGVQQALLKLLEGTTVTLQSKPGASNPPTPISSSRLTDATRDPPTQRGFGGSWGSGQHELGYGAKKGVREGLPLHGGGGGGGANSKGETFTVDTSNILFILSGSFVGLEKIIGRRTGKGSIGFGATLPQHKRESETEDEVADVDGTGGVTAHKKDRLKGLSTADLVEYGFIPEFVGRLPILAPLHPLSLSDLVRILVEPKNALIKQYRKLFARYGCELQFSEKALYAVAEEASKRGGSARHLRSTLEELLLDAMYEIPGSTIRYAAVTEDVVRRTSPTLYYSRGQRETFYLALEADTNTRQPIAQEDDEGEELLRATA
ncbi:ATP-binding protein [Naganishia albida]|nr:ATP-binding protein [Naganishia albida]